MTWYRAVNDPNLSSIIVGDSDVGYEAQVLATEILTQGIEEWLERQAEGELYGQRYGPSELRRELVDRQRAIAERRVPGSSEWY